MKHVEIYTDGACSGNPGIGGWAAILSYNGAEKEVSGGEAVTTNNRMELSGVINGLRALKEPCAVSIYSDSSYVVNAFKNGWLDKWQKNNWMRTKNSHVLNQELWQELVELVAKHQVEFCKVKGHSDVVKNNRCDALARGEVEKIRSQIQIEE